MSEDLATGPLAGVRVVELAGIGPGPFAAMMLADLGADVIRVDRVAEVDASAFGTPHPDLLNRGRRSIGVDLKSADGREVVLALVGAADALIEGFRPGVTERLGVGPADCQAVNPALVYGRMTGWGQDGPNAPYAGHDIDYLALTGALHGIGRAGEPPVPPMNLLGDFGGGGMMLALGVVSALYAVRGGGTGQVVDAAVVDGVAVLSTQIHALHQLGMWRTPRGVNLLDGGAPFYDTYECADGRYLAVGALEPRFYDELVRRTGFPLPPDEPIDRTDPANWPALRAAWARLFRTRTRDEWAALLTASDACAAPVLDWQEASEHPHLAARRTFVLRDGVVQPAPAPRFSATPTAIRRPPPWPGEHTDEVLTEAGFDRNRVAQLRASGAVG
ncbi:CaiB/BaiF CoA-transferase family protein [Verrucosispora sp. WMMA2044]|uniref:CoA transferase n=1 Tax=Verrucosispora sioxanthis TaxID=2499994 RepID=A0A6M1L007_9ACTN|nr:MULTISPECIES: CaiB/BaiF CoA-transferase family protein [Micromonospora]NEE64302.1 CoA transferase [Verrucosispora sioxanthis]NGM13412.1 CoA transferase [Verrucosispora sioxanthis]WBB51385.1 CaiB/BaiF CoA-transferase family protein [Verrucosispora sp. WMMA2044]